jgi:hypothetical protein
MECWRKKLAVGGLLTAIVALNGGCMGDVGKPTDQEIAQMQAWAEVVTPQDREVVTREANQHTDWAERRKVQFITGEYKKRYNHAQTHPKAVHPATMKSSNAPSTFPATFPATFPGSGGL